ncbi:IS1096 element passenger TnpR family protein [Variovorax boronicumulans]|uniref:IS1096 element passenger TnpR family protein n=1 Tax=Variovorax boronicumulans TaxID=436515 RepID=UPI00358EE032
MAQDQGRIDRQLESPIEYAQCVGGENAYPPDVGGSLGYEEFLEALVDPASRARRDEGRDRPSLRSSCLRHRRDQCPTERPRMRLSIAATIEYRKKWVSNTSRPESASRT